jgi:hypothetical protein
MKRAFQNLTPGVLGISLALTLVLVSCGGGPAPSDERKNFAAATPSPQPPAIAQPDKFNWELFASINKPAQAGSPAALWESWASDDDLYGNPNATPLWPGSTPTFMMQRAKTKKLRPITQIELGRQEMIQSNPPTGPNGKGASPQFLPPQAASEEVRLNKPAFDFIVSNNLWYVQGQEAAFKKGDKIDFPTDAVEIKAIWRPIKVTEESRFHWANNPADGNKPYGLIALHIISKAIPNWTWATFEQVDNPNRCKVGGCSDAFGLTASGQVSPDLLQVFATAGLGQEWQNYRLTGSQVDFVKASGQPTLLGNSEIESSFMLTSSCITCHARAAIGAPKPGTNRLSIFRNGPPPPTPPDTLASYNGQPDPLWYFTNPNDPATRKYLQLDFVWSFLRAKRR